MHRDKHRIVSPLAGVLALTLVLLPSIITHTTFAATGHGCAPAVPPGIPGSPAPAPAAAGVIVINEVLLSPHSTWNCSETSGTYFTITDSWIELYNTQNQPYNLYSAHAVIDSGPNTNPYYFPFAASIAAHGYLVVFPLINAKFEETETPLLRLIISSVTLDQVTVPTLGPDQSFARTSDGASTWAITSTPTIDASNTSLVTPTATSSGTGATRGTGTSTPVTHNSIVSGSQPQWNSLQLPGATPTPTISAGLPPTTLSTTSPTATNNGLGLLQRLLLTILAIALAASLWWGWRSLRKPQLKPH